MARDLGMWGLDAIAGALGAAIYIASTVAVLVAVLANLRLPGMAIVALGSISNLAAIVANGGSMPASSDASAAAGLDASDVDAVVTVSSTGIATPSLGPLSDRARTNLTIAREILADPA